MRLNTASTTQYRTHEGAAAVPPKNALAALRRATMSCMLWEDGFYESGAAIADRIKALVAQCSTEDVSALAIEARTSFKLRHAPLWLLASLADAGRTANAETIAAVISRADEMGEMLAQFWKDKRRPLPAQLKRGLAQAFTKFDEYQLGKYDRKTAIKLRDVLRLAHPKPASDEQAALWKRVIDGTLATPDTWEVALSGGADKKATFERLLREEKLGYLALLRNLRNMAEAGVDTSLVRSAILARKGAHNVLPFRFVTAARHAPMFEPALDEALCAAIEHLPVLPGKTVVCVDTSGSMSNKLSAKSELTRCDAAAVLGSMINGDVRLLSFASGVEELPPRRGMAGADTIRNAVGRVGHGTDIAGVVRAAQSLGPDRIVVITDEQSATTVYGPGKAKGYIINVASDRNGIGFGDWTRIDGFSESTLRFISESERDA